MDIFEYADQIGWLADYMDMRTGYVYCIQNATDRNSIMVMDADGAIIGVVRRKTQKEENSLKKEKN